MLRRLPASMPDPAVLRGPGFAWWYLDAIDPSGNGFVLIWSFGLPFLPGVTPRADERPSLNLAVYERGRPVFYTLQEVEAAWDGEVFRFGRCTLETRISGDDWQLRADLDGDLPAGRFTGTIRASGRTARTPEAGAGDHEWAVLATGTAEADIEADGSRWQIRGRAYHDRNSSPVALGALGIRQWWWGRIALPEGDLVFYRLVGSDGGIEDHVFHVGERGREGAGIVPEGRRRSLYGPTWPARLVVDGLSIDLGPPLDEGPFYMRLLARAGAATGYVEIVCVRADRAAEVRAVRADGGPAALRELDVASLVRGTAGRPRGAPRAVVGVDVSAPRAIVVGAGIGGLSAAIALASRGLGVRVIEAASGPGGKAGVALIDGVEVDTGPSVLTLPHVFDDLLRLAGTVLADEVELVSPDPAFRYLWPDGTALDVFVDPQATLASVRGALGTAAEADLGGFLSYARRIWEAAAPRFVLGPAPSFGGILSLSAMRDLAAIDPLRTMQRAIDDQVRSPHLRMLLARYATYNGSDPRRAPATLSCIAHVELALGGFGIRGGVHAIVRALVRAAERLGVTFVHDTPVQRITIASGRVTGVVTASGELAADVVVANADVAHVFGTLTDLRAPTGAPSTSGWTAIVRARREPRIAHTVLFPSDYAAEFADLFDARRAPREPTVYLCAQEVAHGRSGWSEAEPVFLMANTPADPSLRCDPLRGAVLDRARAAGLLAPEDAIVWERTPAGLATRFPGSRGALYGAASNDRFAAFRRPSNRVAGVRGLYLASGSAHPGGGLPLCALSGRAAAAAAVEDAA